MLETTFPDVEIRKKKAISCLKVALIRSLSGVKGLIYICICTWSINASSEVNLGHFLVLLVFKYYFLC